ncbi:excisionase, partial [uncultured Phocaeicola sp.]|uniref:excisionase n=1 Tax=uncultured Phocaeicola sp. TaxID=990718 RepID=UPI00343B55AA
FLYRLAERPALLYGVSALGDRYMLTVREAAEYFGIGEHKLRDLLDKNPEKNLSVWNGNRQLIRRKRLEEYLDDCDSI